MRKNIARWSTLLLAIFLANSTFAQAGDSSGSGGSMNLLYALVVLVLFFVAMRFFGAGRFKKADGKSISLKRGHDIELNGAAGKTLNSNVKSKTFAVRPPDFFNISPIPKVTVEVGDEVKAGDVIFFDKKRPEIKYSAPVSGEVIAINRGAKRSISEVIILADKEINSRSYDAFNLEGSDRGALVNYLLESGVWPMIKQRPFNVIADPAVTPVNIFVSTFDTAPLAPDLSFVVEGSEEAFQKGLDVLGKLTSGKVHLGIDGRGGAVSNAFSGAQGVETRSFNGKHPIGNVGVQIHHVSPVSNEAIAWTMGVQEVITLGKLFLNKQFDASRVVAVAGAVNDPQYISTFQGANVGDLVKDNLSEGKMRLISGDILSGRKKDKTHFLGYHDDQVSVVKEGDYYEMFGWMVPQTKRPTVSKTFFGGFSPSRKTDADTNMHGEKRAFVVSGEYESMLPMDIYPQFLLRSIIVGDFEKMEGLGIYEVVEEDIALCEFACTSKQPLQSILRGGLNEMIEQG
jgi:Na+-transporting NADH:ubiquinone oxidoreductase subunit A